MNEQAPRVSPRVRWLAVAALVGTAVAGILVGAVMDRTLLMWGAPGARGMPLAAGGEPTPEMRKRLARRLASDLNLSDAQRVKVEELMEQQMPRMRATGDSVQAMVERSLAESREQMMKILTPEQQRKFSTILPPGRPGRR